MVRYSPCSFSGGTGFFYIHWLKIFDKGKLFIIFECKNKPIDGMSEKKKALKRATVDLGNLDWETAYMTVHGLVKSSGLTMNEVAKCIGKTRQTLLLVLTTPNYPLLLIKVLECLGYKAKIQIVTEIDDSVEVDDE